MKQDQTTPFIFFLEQMLDALKLIREYTSNKNYEQFSENSLIRDAVIRNFEVLGESVKHIPFSYQRKHPKLPWEHMLALRNTIVHEFFDVDDEILWAIIQNDLNDNIENLKALVGHS